MVGIGQYFLVNTIRIPKENLVGTFSIVDTKKYVFTVFLFLYLFSEKKVKSVAGPRFVAT